MVQHGSRFGSRGGGAGWSGSALARNGAGCSGLSHPDDWQDGRLVGLLFDLGFRLPPRGRPIRPAGQQCVQVGPLRLRRRGGRSRGECEPYAPGGRTESRFGRRAASLNPLLPTYSPDTASSRCRDAATTSMARQRRSQLHSSAAACCGYGTGRPASRHQRAPRRSCPSHEPARWHVESCSDASASTASLLLVDGLGQFPSALSARRAAQYFRIRSATGPALLLGHRALAPSDRLDRLLAAAPGDRRANSFNRLDGTLNGDELAL